MADLLNVGTRALTAFQTAISTTGNNIVNANTEGYSRQQVNFVTQESQYNGAFYVGNGVGINSVQRAYDQFLSAELMTRTSSEAAVSTLYSMSSQLEAHFAEPNFGLQSSLDNFQSAWSDLANNPSSNNERQVLIAEAENLIDRQKSLGNSLQQISDNLALQVESAVDAINSLTGQLAELNTMLESVPSTASSASEMLDKRDLLLSELSGYVEIDRVISDKGVVSVSLNNGTPLVNGLLNTELNVSRDAFGDELLIGPAGVSGGLSREALTAGGSLGGLLRFQEEVLDPTIQEFGLMSLTLAAAVNQQQALGLDLNGNQGDPMFYIPDIPVTESSYNNGSAVLSVSLEDYRNMQSGGFQIAFDGTDWTMTNLDTGDSQTGAMPIAMAGLEVSVTGTAVAGDEFLVHPARELIGEVELAISNPSSIAAAGALRSSADLANTGTSLVSTEVTDTSSLPLASDIQLTYDPDALGAGIPGFTLTSIAGGPLAYDPATDSGGLTYSLTGLDITLSGTPAEGDTLTIENNIGATGDNSNAMALVDLLDAKVLTESNQGIKDINAWVLSYVGAKTSGAESSLDIETTLLASAEQTVANLSGVNLDEEDADLMSYQQAYQAAAQIISIAETLFDTLLNATRR